MRGVNLQVTHNLADPLRDGRASLVILAQVRPSLTPSDLLKYDIGPLITEADFDTFS